MEPPNSLLSMIWKSYFIVAKPSYHVHIAIWVCHELYIVMFWKPTEDTFQWRDSVHDSVLFRKCEKVNVIVTCLGRCYAIVHVFPGQKRPNKSKVYISFQQEHHGLAFHVVYFCHDRSLGILVHILCRYTELKRLNSTANFLSVYQYTADFHHRLSSAIFTVPF